MARSRDDALAELIPAVYPWATAVAYLLCRNAAQAQDLVQEALLRAVRRPPEPLDAATLRAWLRPVIFRLYLRHRERARREALALFRIGHERHADISWTGANDDLIAALGQLSPKQRACIVLRYMDDLPEDEVARVLGLRLGTVKTHLARARESLRASLRPAAEHAGEPATGPQPPA